MHELKESRDGQASDKMLSLDTDYYFHQKFPPKNIERWLLQNSTAGRKMKNGYSVVKDKRKNSTRPMFTLDKPRSRVVMPVYPKVKEIT